MKESSNNSTDDHNTLSAQQQRFRFNDVTDAKLLEHVLRYEPYEASYGTRATCWDLVRDGMSSITETGNLLTSRACRDRFKIIMSRRPRRLNGFSTPSQEKISSLVRLLKKRISESENRKSINEFDFKKSQHHYKQTAVNKKTQNYEVPQKSLLKNKEMNDVSNSSKLATSSTSNDTQGNSTGSSGDNSLGSSRDNSSGSSRDNSSGSSRDNSSGSSSIDSDDTTEKARSSSDSFKSETARTMEKLFNEVNKIHILLRELLEMEKIKSVGLNKKKKG